VHPRPDDPLLHDMVGADGGLVGVADTGVYRTTGEVEDWAWEQTEVSTGWTAVAADGSTVVAVGDGIALSTDGGVLWRRVLP
jgi:hypothetical protein